MGWGLIPFTKLLSHERKCSCSSYRHQSNLLCHALSKEPSTPLRICCPGYYAIHAFLLLVLEVIWVQTLNERRRKIFTGRDFLLRYRIQVIPQIVSEVIDVFISFLVVVFRIHDETGFRLRFTVSGLSNSPSSESSTRTPNPERHIFVFLFLAL